MKSRNGVSRPTAGDICLLLISYYSCVRALVVDSGGYILFFWRLIKQICDSCLDEVIETSILGRRCLFGEE